jgi:hypothetical protein
MIEKHIIMQQYSSNPKGSQVYDCLNIYLVEKQ